MTNAMTETSPATTTDTTAQRTPYAVSQIFHIFRKDARHHWPEILVSLLVLAAYTWYSGRQAGPAPFFVPGYPTTSALWIALAGVLPLLLVVAWFFLIFRVVQDESLIGDRQFWVTRPYRWPSLLAAKVLFLVAFVHFPLFVAHCILLQLAGFPFASHLMGLIVLQVGLAFFLLFPSTIAVLTRSLPQALVGTLAALLLFFLYDSGVSAIPNHALSGLAHSFGDTLQAAVLLFAPIAVTLWQYARRRIVPPTAILLSAGLLIALSQVATPYRTLLESQFPLPNSVHPAPVELAILPPPPLVSNPAAPLPYPLADTATINIPLRVSGVTPGSAVVVSAIRASIQGQANFEWHSNWTGYRLYLWPDSTSGAAHFSLPRSTYDRLRSSTVRVRLAFAVSRYAESAPREIVLPDGRFAAFGNGYCWLSTLEYFPVISCRTALQQPGFIAGAVVTTASCSDENPSAASRQMAHEFVSGVPPRFVGFGFNPVRAFSIYLRPASESLAPLRTHLCPGTTIHLATPVPAGQWRITVEAGGVKLEDYALDARSGPAAYGISSLSPLH